MTQIKNKKKRSAISAKKDYSVRHFASFLTTPREIPKNKRKNPEKICHLIFVKIFPH